MANLIINDWFSKCSACGGNADPQENSHISGGPGTPYTQGSSLGSKNGCREPFTQVIHEGRAMSNGAEPRLVTEARIRIDMNRGRMLRRTEGMMASDIEVPDVIPSWFFTDNDPED